MDDGMIMCSFEEPAFVTIAQRVASGDTSLVCGDPVGKNAQSEIMENFYLPDGQFWCLGRVSKSRS